MGLFRRRRDSSGSDRIEAVRQFWQWWAGGGSALVEAGLASGEPAAALSALAGQVDSVDPSLAWEVTPASASRHLLVVTADGSTDLRPLARRWRSAAPPPDAAWSYADARPPVADPEGFRVQLGAWDIDLARATADARVASAAVHVSVFHPDFHHLDEGTRHVGASLLLAALLGEHDVEVWVGSARGTEVPPLDAVPLAGLRAVVRDLKEQWAAGGGYAWVDGSGTAPDGTPMLAAAQVPLRPATAPHLDSYVAALVPYADATPEGLPGPAAVARLEELARLVGTRLGDGGAVVAHQSHEGARALHVYLDSAADVLAELRAALAGWPDGPVHLTPPVLDPAWESVAHLR